MRFDANDRKLRHIRKGNWRPFFGGDLNVALLEFEMADFYKNGDLLQL